MAAQRPLVLAALKAVLSSNVPLVAGRICLPWDDRIDPREGGQLLDIEIGDTEIDDSEVLGMWLHKIPVRLGAVRAGVFDYPAVWEILHQAAQALLADPDLGGVAERVEIVGGSDSVEMGGSRIIWPHLQCEIYYLTPIGSL